MQNILAGNSQENVYHISRMHPESTKRAMKLTETDSEDLDILNQLMLLSKSGSFLHRTLILLVH